MENLTFFASEGIESIPFARITLDRLRVQFNKVGTTAYVNLFG